MSKIKNSPSIRAQLNKLWDDHYVENNAAIKKIAALTWESV